VWLLTLWKGESAKKDSSADAEPATSEDDDHARNDRTADTEVDAVGNMSLEEQTSNETREDGGVQVSDVSSSTTETPSSVSETHREVDGLDTAAETNKHSSSDQVSSSSVDVSGPASVEVAAEKHVTSVNDVDGVAVCLRWNASGDASGFYNGGGVMSESHEGCLGTFLVWKFGGFVLLNFVEIWRSNL